MFAGFPRLAAAFVGDSDLVVGLRSAPPAELACDDVVELVAEVSADRLAADLLTQEMRKRFRLEAVVRGQSGASTRVISWPLAIGSGSERVNIRLGCWPISGPADLEVWVQHPDLPGYISSRQVPLTIQPPRFVYEVQGAGPTGGAQAWRAVAPTDKLQARQGEKVNLRVRSTGGRTLTDTANGVLRLRDGASLVKEQTLMVDGAGYAGSLDLGSVPAGIYYLEVSLDGAESVKGAIPIFGNVGSGHARLQSATAFVMQVLDPPQKPLSVTSAIDLPSSLRQGSTLRGAFRVRIEGGAAADRAIVGRDLAQRTPSLRMAFNPAKTSRDMELTVGPLVERKTAGEASEFEAAIESKACQYVGQYALRAEAIHLAQKKTIIAEKEATFEVSPGLVQCVVLRENTMGVSRGLLDSLQPSFQEDGQAFLGEEISLEVRRSSACEKNLFIALQREVQLWFIQNGIMERVPIEIKGDKYVSRKSRLAQPGRFEFRAILRIGEEEITLTGHATIIEPVVSLAVTTPERFPSLVPEGVLLPLRIQVACNVNDPQDAEAILQPYSLNCEVLDSRGEMIKRETRSLPQKDADWNPSVCLLRRGQLTVRVRLEREGRSVKQVELPMEVGAAPVAFVGPNGQPITGSGGPVLTAGLRRDLLMTPRRVTVKAVPFLSSPFWTNYVPQLMRVRGKDQVLERKYDTEELVWDIDASAATGAWTGEVLLTPMRRRDGNQAELQLRYPLSPLVSYAVSWKKALTAAVLVGLVTTAGVICLAAWTRRRRAAEADAAIPCGVTSSLPMTNELATPGTARVTQPRRRLARTLDE